MQRNSQSGKAALWPQFAISLLLAFTLSGCGKSIEDAHAALARGEATKAIEIYKAVAEKDNNSMAMRMLGTIYMTGNGVPKDYTAAEVWFQEGVKAGDGVCGDLLESVRNLRRAEGGGGTTAPGDGNKASKCAHKRSNCNTACGAAPSIGGYGTSSRSGCYAGCDAKYNSCMN